MAAWTKNNTGSAGRIASAVSCTSLALATWQACLSAGVPTLNCGTAVSVSTEVEIGVSGTITNTSGTFTSAPVVALIGSNDGGTTWYLIARCPGNTTAAFITDFAFNDIPSGWAMLELVVYGFNGTSTPTVTLNADCVYVATVV